MCLLLLVFVPIQSFSLFLDGMDLMRNSKNKIVTTYFLDLSSLALIGYVRKLRNLKRQLFFLLSYHGAVNGSATVFSMLFLFEKLSLFWQKIVFFVC